VGFRKLRDRPALRAGRSLRPTGKKAVGEESSIDSYSVAVPRRSSRRSSAAIERAVWRLVPPPVTVTLMSPTLVTLPPSLR
jgi:hypothetical protein